MKNLTLALIFAASAFPQTNPGNVGGPTLGLVFDGDSGSIRPLLGVPGSSTVGTAFDAAGLVSAAASREYALAINGDGAAILVSATGRRPLPGAAPGASRVVVSPGGTAAAVYFESGTAQIFTGMPDAPQSAGSIAFDRPPAELAISDDGATLLAASRNGRDGDAVYAYTPGQAPQLLHRARRVSALTFIPGTAKALIADGESIRIVSVSGSQMVDPAVSGVVALAASPDGATVLAATGAGEIVTYDLRALSRTSLSCGCVPSTFAPLRGKAVFRLNELGNGPLWVFDGDSPEARILFVPAPAGGSR